MRDHEKGPVELGIGNGPVDGEIVLPQRSVGAQSYSEPRADEVLHGRLVAHLISYGPDPGSAAVREVGGHLGLPVFVGVGRVHLELEARRHLRVDVIDVAVELLVPPTMLIDRSVFLAK